MSLSVRDATGAWRGPGWTRVTQNSLPNPFRHAVQEQPGQPRPRPRAHRGHRAVRARRTTHPARSQGARSLAAPGAHRPPARAAGPRPRSSTCSAGAPAAPPATRLIGDGPARRRADGVHRARLVEPARGRRPSRRSGARRSATTSRSCCSRARSWPGCAASTGAAYGWRCSATSPPRQPVTSGGTSRSTRDCGPDVSGEIPDLTRAELEALQLERLRETLRSAYEQVPHYRHAFDEAGVGPDDLASLGRPRAVPVHRQGRPAGELPVRDVRGAARAGGARPRLERHDGQADRGRLHPRGHRHLGRGDGALDPGRGRPARRPRARGLRLRAVHRRARRALRRRAARLHGGADQRRHDRAAGAADRATSGRGSSWSRRRTSSRSSTRSRRQGVDPRSTQPRDRHLRRRAVDRRDAARGRGAQRDHGGRHLRALGGDGAGRQPGGRGDPGRPARLGGPLPAGDHRPGHARGAAGRRGGRAGLHLADQAGDAGRALPHPRPHPAAARHGVPGLPADAEGHRPHRRHDDRARRQRVPEPGRGADPHHRGTDAALPVRAVAPRQPRRAHRPGRGVRRAGADRDALGRALADRVKQRIGVTIGVEVLAPHALERSLGKAKRISDQRH